jgi:aminobenzoyl-glutamate utilization protein B
MRRVRDERCGVRRAWVIVTCVVLLGTHAAGQDAPHAKIIGLVEGRAIHFGNLARQIWENPEPGYKETKSAALLAGELRQEGFRVRENVAGIPTAFIAEWGTGKPVIGIMGEYDALPGLSQEVAAEKKARVAGGYGHACGHNLLGAASALAAIATKTMLDAERLPGTIRFYGTPAEEGGGGKTFMAREGVFNDADIVLHWHPGDRNIATTGSTLAITSAKFTFQGRAAHAASAPEKGRSALDAAVLMAHALDMLREHLPEESRLHYVFTRGGDAPNIVPAEAQVYLYARHPRMRVLEDLWPRVIKCAEAGALATETTMTMELVHSDYDVLPNDVLSKLLDSRLREVGGVKYTPEEQSFAEAIRKTLPLEGALPLGSQEGVRPPDERFAIGSTDAGDVSWIVPTGWFFAATQVPGVPNHTWQAAACTGGTIGRKGMVVAAKTLALAAFDLLTTPSLVADARANFEKRRGGEPYRSRLPEGMKPPLDYRDTH